MTQKTIDNWEHDKTYPKSAIGALEDVLGIAFDGEPDVPPPALADLYPAEDEWERSVLADPDLTDAWKRELITSSRAARAAYRERKARQAARAGRPA